MSTTESTDTKPLGLGSSGELGPLLERLRSPWHHADCRAAAAVIERLRDCRTCAHHTYASGGCMSALRCVGGDRYTPTQPRKLWEERPCEPAPF